MKESRVWEWIDRQQPWWLAIERLEVKYPTGLSDCFFTDKRTCISGWLELKYCAINDSEFKAGRIPKIKPEQPMFLRRQAAKGIPAGIILRVGNVSWWAFRATEEPEWSNIMRSNQAIIHANQVWTEQPSVADVISVIQGKSGYVAGKLPL